MNSQKVRQYRRSWVSGHCLISSGIINSPALYGSPLSLESPLHGSSSLQCFQKSFSYSVSDTPGSLFTLNLFTHIVDILTIEEKIPAFLWTKPLQNCFKKYHPNVGANASRWQVIKNWNSILFLKNKTAHPLYNCSFPFPIPEKFLISEYFYLHFCPWQEPSQFRYHLWNLFPYYCIPHPPLNAPLFSFSLPHPPL